MPSAVSSWTGVISVSAGAPNVAADLGRFGADRILVAEHVDLEHYNPDAAVGVLASLIRDLAPGAILLPASAQGKDLGARLAAELDLGLAELGGVGGNPKRASHGQLAGSRKCGAMDRGHRGLFEMEEAHHRIEVPAQDWSPFINALRRVQQMTADEIPARNLVFLLDVSGSMSSPNKLQLVKNAMTLLI